MYFTFVFYERSWGSRLQSPGEIPGPCFLVTVGPDSNTCTVCTVYFHMTLQCEQENREDLKYLKNVYCVMTNHSKDQDMQTGRKTTN